MIRLDHIGISVRDVTRSRDWYVNTLGLKVEFEIPEAKTVALQDESDFTIFLGEKPQEDIIPTCVLTFQVDDVDSTYHLLADRGVNFDKEPQKLLWGYGAELRDPDGYLICLWDEKTMKEKG